MAATFVLFGRLFMFCQTVPNVQGVKIISSNIDLKSGQRQITIVNDTPVNITAYDIVTVNIHPDGSTSLSSMPKEFLSPEWQMQLKHRPFLSESSGVANVVHPGESRTESWTQFGGSTLDTALRSVSLGVDVAIYSDGTGEVRNEEVFNSLIQNRKNNASEYQTIADTGRQILMDPNISQANVLAAFRTALQTAEASQHPPIATLLENLDYVIAGKSNQQFRGTLLEVICKAHEKDGKVDQRGVLQDLIADNDEIAAIWRNAANIRVVQR